MSKEKAESIACEYINNDIIKIDSDTIHSCSTRKPISYVVEIRHIDLDKNIFKTIVEINNNGVVVSLEDVFLYNQDQDIQ